MSRSPARRLLTLALGLSLAAGVGSGCARKSGCPVNDAAHAEADKKGRFKKGKTKSGLFPKDMRKSMRRN